MSLGLSYLSAVCAAGARDQMRLVSDEWFTEEEWPSWGWVSSYYRRFGALPTLPVLEQAGVRLPPAQGRIAYYHDRLRTRQVLRRVVELHSRLKDSIGASDVAGVRAALVDMLRAEEAFRDRRDLTTLAEAAADVLEDYQAARRQPGLRGVTFGWDYLDQLTGGAMPEDVVTVVGRPGTGKSYTMIRMAARAWMAGHRVLFVTMEMSTLQTARRLLAVIGGFEVGAIQRGRLASHALVDLHETIERVEQGQTFHLLSGNFRKSTADVSALVAEVEPAAVWIDASYLLKPSKDSRLKKFEALADVGEEVKGIAQDRRVPVIQSVQFSRKASQEGGGGVALENIGGTDVVGQISSIVVGQQAGEGEHETTTRRFSVIKNRDGRDGKFLTNFRFTPFDMDLVTVGHVVPDSQQGPGGIEGAEWQD